MYDAFESQEGFLTSFSPVPKNLETLSFPVGVRYFDPSGFLAGVTVTRIDQKVVRTPTAKLLGFSDGHEDFTVVDATIGWRFPKRFGTAILTVYNLLDDKFRYQDDGYREFRDEPSTSPYIPERRVVGRVSLYF